MWSQRQSDKTIEKNASELRRQIENLWIEKKLDLRKIELYMKSLAGRKNTWNNYVDSRGETQKLE